jgi:hypothetical protein
MLHLLSSIDFAADDSVYGLAGNPGEGFAKKQAILPWKTMAVGHARRK